MPSSSARSNTRPVGLCGLQSSISRAPPATRRRPSRSTRNPLPSSTSGVSTRRRPVHLTPPRPRSCSVWRTTSGAITGLRFAASPGGLVAVLGPDADRLADRLHVPLPLPAQPLFAHSGALPTHLGCHFLGLKPRRQV